MIPKEFVMTDPIADMLTRIRNAHMALHKEVRVPRSKMKEAIAAILKQEGYVDAVTVEEKDIAITLRYFKGTAGIAGLQRISTPGRRRYVGYSAIPKVQNGLGICILSTSSGVLDGETARTQKVGGELLCEIW
jgi:small subunit ribosomal protein S8